VNCPKCQFETTEAACPRCGVVFHKLGRDRPPRPETSPPPAVVAPPPAVNEASDAPFSLVNAGILTTLLLTTSYYAWTVFSPSETAPGPESGEPSMARPETGAVVSPELEGPDTVDYAQQPVDLAVYGGGMADAPVVVAPVDVAEEIPDLPDLSETMVTDALLERAQALARKYPGVDSLREYVIAAHMLAVGQELRRRRFGAALRYLDASEDWGPPPGDIAAFRAVIYGEQEQWTEAMRWAQAALTAGSRASPAEMHHIIGKVHYYREEMSKAVASFRTALKIKDDPEIRASLERALREAQTSAGFDSRRLAHFIIRYEGETMEDTGRMVLDTMDRSYATLTSQLGFEPSERVVVVLYSRRDYRDMGGPHWSAGLFDGKIRIPVRGLQRLDEHIKSTLHHELAHAFIHARAGKAAPRWLHEGIAEYVEGTRTDDNGDLLAQALDGGGTFEHCLKQTARCDIRLFYPAAASFVDYMVQLRGLRALRNVLTELGDGADMDSALKRAFSKDSSALIRDWEHFVRRRYG